MNDINVITTRSLESILSTPLHNLPMLPIFPAFKELEWSDKPNVEAYTSIFPPYSDYNFESLYAWNIEGHIRLSQLNANLVVRFADYITGIPFYAFMGINKPNETAQALLELSIEEHREPMLKFIPAETAALLNTELYTVTEDRNAFDYIYDTNEHRAFAGSTYARKRNEVSALLKSHSAVEARCIEVSDMAIQQKMRSLYYIWTGNKLIQDKGFEQHEAAAFNRMLDIAREHSDALTGIGVYHNDDLLAFCIFAQTGMNYAVGHTAKNDVSIKGTNAFLMQRLAEVLHSSGIRYFNYEQDLGIENLRTSKVRFRPSFFLKKYIVREQARD